MEQSQDVARAGETAEAMKQQLSDLEARFQEELAQVESAYDPTLEVFETLELKPKKGDVLVKLVALAWVP
jgi:prefoldin subunit 5